MVHPAAPSGARTALDGLFPSVFSWIAEAIHENFLPATHEHRWSWDRKVRATTTLCAAVAPTRSTERGPVKTMALARPTRSIPSEGLFRGDRVPYGEPIPDIPGSRYECLSTERRRRDWLVLCTPRSSCHW